MIERMIVIALLVDAIHYTLQHGEIFGGLGDWFHDHLPEAVHAPVFDCNVCMTPWYGSGLYWLIWNGSVKEWAIVIITAMGLNAILNRLTTGNDK